MNPSSRLIRRGSLSKDGYRHAAGSQADPQKELRASYDAERLRDIMPFAARLGLVFVVAANAAFLLVDSLGKPHVGVTLLALRIATALSAVPLIVTAPRRPLRSAVVGCYLTGIMLISVIHVAGGVTGNYAPGLMLLFVGIPVLLPLTPRESALIVAPLQCLFVISAFFELPRPSMVDLAVHTAFPLAAAVECVFSCFVLDRIRFRAFLHTREVKHAHDELARLDEAKTRFAANVHHELRTPLTLILGPIESLLERRAAWDDNAVASLESINRNANRLLAMVNGLLDLSRIEANAFRLRRRPDCPDQIVEDVVSSTGATAERKRISLRRDLAGRSRSVDLDATAFGTVAMNLIGNAIKFTPPGGAITVRTWCSRCAWELAVHDSGVGIPATDLTRIFDRFAQVDSSDTRPFEGAGIGLSVSREIVRLHEGEIWAESDGRGRGSTFRVRLPLSTRQIENDEVNSSIDRQSLAISSWLTALEGEVYTGGQALGQVCDESRAEREESNSLDSVIERHSDRRMSSVLVVDDNAEMRRLLEDLLGQEFEVATAVDAIDALKFLRFNSPDVLIVDQMMPKMSGLEFCRTLKANPRTKLIPVALLTARSDVECRIAGLETGADDFLSKPVSPRVLRARVRSLSRISSLRKALEARNQMLVESNRQLTESRREMQLLVRAISHDIRSPIVAAGEALRLSSESNRKTSLLAIADENIDRAERMIDGLRELVAGVGRPAEWEETQMSVLLRGVIKDLEVDRELLGVSRRVELSPDLPTITCQPIKIALAFRQLLQNAFWHGRSGDDSCVEVGYSRTADWHVFAVTDDGPGVPWSVRDTAFEPFVTGARNHRAGGLGLGLSIARQIVQDHGGRLWLDLSREVGARFVVEIPDRDSPDVAARKEL